MKPRTALAVFGALLAVTPASALANPTGAQHATVTGGDNDLIDLGGGGGNDVIDVGSGNDLIDLIGDGGNDVIDVVTVPAPKRESPNRCFYEQAHLAACIESRRPVPGGNDGFFTGMTDEEFAQAAGEPSPSGGW